EIYCLSLHDALPIFTNGFDGDISTEKIVDKKFTMSHIGSLLSDRNPEVLWSVLSELVTTDPDFATDFRLQLVGVVSDTVLQSLRSEEHTSELQSREK